jgi:hypothetical protein
MSNYGDSTQSISIGRLSKVVNGITHLQSPLDDSKHDHTLIRNSVTTDSTFRDEQHPNREHVNDDAKSPEERYQNCDELHRLSSRDDADLINDIMNQKSSDEDYDFKLVESMDEVDGDNMNSVRGVSPVINHHPGKSGTDDIRAARNNDVNNIQLTAEQNTRKNPFHPPKLLMPHQIATFEKKKHSEQHRYHGSNNHTKWNSGNPPRKSTSSRYTSGEDGYYHDFNSGNKLPSSSSYSSHAPLVPSAETSPPTLSQSTKGSTGTQVSRKRQLTDTEDGQLAGRLPTIINMKRSRNHDQEPLWNDRNNPRKSQGNSSISSSFNEYDPYNSINHIQPHYTSSSHPSDSEIRRTWSTSSTASSLSAGGMSSTLSSTASFDHGHPDLAAACNKSKNNNTYNGMVGMSSISQCSATTASYSKFDLLSIEDSSVISSRMFTANGKPFSTSPIMGAGSTSTIASMAVDKKRQTGGVNETVKPDPGVTPISKNTRRDRENSYHHHYNHENKFSFSETPGPSSVSSYGFSSNKKKVGERKDSQDYRQRSFTPIPMNPSDDIDDMHNITIQQNLSWSIMGEHSPLGGESDGIDPWSAALKDSWSRGNTHDILSTLSPNSEAGIKSPCIAEFFDLPHPEERENLGKGAGHYHSYTTHHHPHQQSSHPPSQGYATNSQMGGTQPPHHFTHQDSNSAINHIYGGHGGRTPIKPHYHHDPNCLPGNNNMMRNHPPPTPVGNVWSSDHYGPPVMSNGYPAGLDQPGHPKTGRRSYHIPHGSYLVDTRDDSNTSRDGGSYYPPPPMPNPYRPLARGGGSDRVINLRGRVPQVHHSRPHAPPPPHHYDGPSHHAAPIHPHHHPVAGRSQWVGRHGPPVGQHQLHSHRHVPSSTRSMIAQPTTQHLPGVDSIHSRRKCIPLKPPIPSKFQGDLEKFKDASVPEFTNLVNYPANIANKMAAMAGDGMKICVMCGAACPCSSIPKGKCKGGSEKEDGRGQVHHHKQPPNAHKLNGTASSGQGCHAIIPTQNKGLCTFCDVNVWVVLQTGLEIKWCKGCKNFRPWAAFGDKGLATKCVRCRDRQREKYAIQKEEKEKTRGDDSSALAIEI